MYNQCLQYSHNFTYHQPHFMPHNEPVFTKPKHARQFSVKISYSEFHENPTNGLFKRRQTDRHTEWRGLCVRLSYFYFVKAPIN